MKTVDSCYLIGAALDWAVAKCEGAEYVTIESNGFYVSRTTLDYSTDGAEAQQIIEREKISVFHVEEDDPYRIEDGPWAASVKDLDYGITGPTALIAAMRCYVCLKLGETIEIPDELANE